MKYDIIFEDDFLVAVNKPSGLLSIPDRSGDEVSLKQILKAKYGEIFTVHRLDKATSGVIVFAKNDETHKQLSQLFQNRETEKIYVGLVHGRLNEKEGTIDEPIAQHHSGNNKMLISAKGKPAITDYKLLEEFKSYSWVEFNIHTGRTHQIRVHAQSIGNPIVCDDIYGSPEPVFISKLKRNYHLSKKEEAEKPILARLALHAASLKFMLDDAAYFFEAPVPKDLRALLQQLRKYN